MNATQVPGNCPECGRPLTPDAPGGLCSRCLIGQGLDSTVGYAPPEDLATNPSEQASRQVGQELGEYTLLQLLGRGGMGAVYEAQHVPSGRRVALKILNHSLASPDQRRRFLREGRLAAAVNHPHSLYIFGTEEIEGTPVIAMEIAPGGTLQDLVRREGPLPPTEAVDLVLDIIAGLEAAAKAGVLHRDIKPANCFLAGDPAPRKEREGLPPVKIGDFGLSISTALRTETNLTQSGVFLGTPVFASPEQLRGDELDVRSDIYSVGVTLFYLLTGETPFRGEHMVQLLATVLEQPAPSPRSFEPSLPRGLANVVLRCLAKQPSQRFRDYGELREALLPYASAAPTAATLGLRLVAGLVDFVVWIVLAALLPLIWSRDTETWYASFEALSDPVPQSTEPLMVTALIGMVLALGYYTLLEGLWGTTPGKNLCGLIVERSGRERPGLSRALLRVILFSLPAWLPYWLWFAFDPEVDLALLNENMTLTAICFGVSVLYFATARRVNGYAAVHDLASGTRVVRRRAAQSRPAPRGLLRPAEPADDFSPGDESRLGPYHVLGKVGAGASEFVMGYDMRLLRRVWIRPRDPEAPSLPAKQQSARPGRLRWLQSRRGAASESGDAEPGWDAFEAPTGEALLTLISLRQDWDAVRFWLWDLAVELEATEAAREPVPTLALDRVWITADGRAKLLDFRAPTLPAAESQPPTYATQAEFLRALAVASLAGDPSKAGADFSQLELRLPLAAREFLLRFEAGAERPRSEAFQKLLERPAVVTARQRLLGMAVCWTLPLLAATMFLTFRQLEYEFLQEHPGMGRLLAFHEFHQAFEPEQPYADAYRQAIEVYVAGTFRHLIEDPAIWENDINYVFLERAQQRRLQGWLEKHGTVTDQQLAEAKAQLSPLWTDIHFLAASPYGTLYQMSNPRMFVLLLAGTMTALTILPSWLFVLFTRSTPLLNALGIAIVTARGERASRARMLARHLALWLLVLAGIGILYVAATTGRPRVGSLLVLAGLVGLWASPRTWPDQLAGTWQVPK